MPRYTLFLTVTPCAVVRRCSLTNVLVQDKARAARNKAVTQLRKKKAGVPEDDMRKMNEYVRLVTANGPVRQPHLTSR